MSTPVLIDLHAPGAPAHSPAATPRPTGTTIAKIAFMSAVLIALLIPVLWKLAQLPETPVGRGQWLLLTISAIANVGVIAFHYIVPAHPKFLMLPNRLAVLLVHIASGSVELVAGLLACFAHSRRAAVVQACAALFFHVPSAFLQVRIVFGSKAIMYPSYLLAIILHGFCAAMLLLHSDSLMWAVNTFLVFNIYTWCRVYFYVFDRMNLFSSMKYTIAILAAGVTMLPGLLGSMTMLVVGGFLLVYIVLHRLLFIRSPAQYLDFVREKSREGTQAPDMAAFWSSLVSREEEDRIARRYFDSLDKDAQGNLQPKALDEALAPWGLRPQEIHDFARRFLAAGPVTFERFRENVWSIGAVRSRAVQIVMTGQAESEREKAQLVFSYADTDRDGALAAADLEALLVQWGLPASEAARYLARADADRDGRISFDDFFQRMRPFWRFIFFEVFRAQLDLQSTKDMIGRSAHALRDQHRTRTLRRRVEHELLAHVPFLTRASQELIDDLAASMVEMKFKAGDTVFSAGEAGDTFYIVGAGLIRVHKAGRTISELGPGGCVGEGALLSSEPRSASVSAVQETTLFALKRLSFQYLTEKYPGVRQQLRELHARRQVSSRARTIQEELAEQVPFLRGASEELVNDLAASLETVRCQPGEVIVKEGEQGDSFYILEKGGINVTRGGKSVARLGPGACFGEGALFSGEARSATVLATEATRLFQLRRDGFDRILDRHPEVRRELLALHRSRTAAPFPQ